MKEDVNIEELKEETRESLHLLEQEQEELANRIYRYFDEVNATPVVHHWKYKMDEIDPNEKVTVGLAI